MPSPDVATYVGLDLIDVDAQTLLSNALANLALSFPDWTPREGNTEVVLLEELAAMVEDDVYAIQRIPNGMVEALLRLFGLNRDQGAPPSAVVRFTLADTAGHTIPRGTTVRLNLSDTDPVDLVTEADLVIAPGDNTGTVLASGAEASPLANGKPAGTRLELLDAITYVNAVELDAPASGGRSPEDGDAFLDRAIPVLSRLTTTLVRPVDVLAYVATFPDVTRVRTLDLFNPDDPDSAPGRSPGYLTVAASGAGGSSLGALALASIRANIAARMHAGLIVSVVDANVTVVDVTLRVLRLPDADDAAVIDAVRVALGDYLNPDRWEWADTVRVNELIARADAAAGVDTVLEVTTPAADQPLPGFAPLAKAGLITVTVEAPA